MREDWIRVFDGILLTQIKYRSRMRNFYSILHREKAQKPTQPSRNVFSTALNRKQTRQDKRTATIGSILYILFNFGQEHRLRTKLVKHASRPNDKPSPLSGRKRIDSNQMATPQNPLAGIPNGFIGLHEGIDFQWLE